jgi:hypothetical protein
MKRILLTAIVLLSTVPLVAAEQEKEKEKELGVTFDLQYHSKWLSKGAEAYGQQGALFKTLGLDFYGTGFGVEVIHRNAIGSGYVDKERFDFKPYYKNQMFEGMPYAMNYNLSFEYEYYPGLSRHKANTTYEWIFSFSWPNILPKGFVPSYIAHYEYPAFSGDRYNYVTGWVHRFKLDYNLDVPQLPKPLCLSSEVAYTDGLGGASHDWSYATFGLGTGFDITKNLTFTPGVYHQISMDDSVSKRHNITYCILGMKYKF